MMILAIADLLSPPDLDAVNTELAGASFSDGRATAGWSARLVKQNLQAREGPEAQRARSLIETRLLEHTVFQLATRPKRVIGPLFSRYEPGHAYGVHVDDALLDGVRSDVAFSLFLSPPETYEGGELVIDTAAGEEAFKLPAGSLVTYPATFLHRVHPVSRGSRLVAAGWVRSFVRDPAHRELLFDLDTARRRLFDRDGKSAEADLLAKCTANLLREWCDD
jgi:PKHD-type hydroxylase